MKPFFYYRIIERIYNVGAIWDKMAPSEENAINFAHNNINQEPERYVEGGSFSLEYCLAYSGETINERYRCDNPEEIDLRIADMIALHVTKVPLVVYRGVSKVVFEQMKKNAKYMKGVDLYEKSFLQTSLVKQCEIKERCRLRIYVPEGTQAVYLGNVNEEQFYYEVDLQHGAELKVVSMDEKYINCRLIRVRDI